MTPLIAFHSLAEIGYLGVLDAQILGPTSSDFEGQQQKFLDFCVLLFFFLRIIVELMSLKNLHFISDPMSL